MVYLLRENHVIDLKMLRYHSSVYTIKVACVGSGFVQIKVFLHLVLYSDIKNKNTSWSVHCVT